MVLSPRTCREGKDSLDENFLFLSRNAMVHSCFGRPGDARRLAVANMHTLWKKITSS